SDYAQKMKKLKEEEEVIAIVRQMISIVATLHRHHIAHLHIHPHSFVVFDGGTVTLRCLDQCRHVSDQQYYSWNDICNHQHHYHHHRHHEDDAFATCFQHYWWCLPPDLLSYHSHSFHSFQCKGLQLKACDIYHLGVLTFVIGISPRAREFVLQMMDPSYETRYWNFHDIEYCSWLLPAAVTVTPAVVMDRQQLKKYTQSLAQLNETLSSQEQTRTLQLQSLRGDSKPYNTNGSP
ncbi:hypothetical protein RFI_09864, partial [Reticulomyxa filosa]